MDTVIAGRIEATGPPVPPRPRPKPRIPPRFEGRTLGDYQPRTQSQKTAVEAVRRWLQELEAGPMLALVGPQGVGKSHLLYGAAVELPAELTPWFIRPWYELGDLLRYGDGRREPQEFRIDLWEARIVLLDEVRPTSGTSFDDTELAKFACHAYDQRKPVLITTNVSPLSLVMGAPAASRFTAVELDGPDLRRVA